MLIKAKKSLGQNFLINEDVVNIISKSVEIRSNDILLEIGAGTGNLTEKLINRNPKTIYIIEKDQVLSNLLHKKFGDQLNIINQDILNFDERKISKNKKLIIFGNLPYNISTQILVKQVINSYNYQNIKCMVLMFQKEVADRILAKINKKNYSRISIISQLFFKITKVKDIGPENFNPKPKVDSSILCFYPKNKVYKFNNINNLQIITKIFFNQRRKKIKTPFNIIFKKNHKEILKEFNLNLGPQNLSPEEYCKITRAYEEII